MSQNNAAKEKKSIFSNYVVDGILLIILGVIFLVRPKESLPFFLTVGGIILLIMGGITLLMAIFAKRKQAGANPNAYAGGNPNAYGGGNPNAYAGGNPNAYAGGNPNAYGGGNPNAYGGGNPNAYGGGNPNAYGGGNPNAYANANTNGQNAAGAGKVGGIVVAVVQIVVGILLLAIPDFFANLFPYIAGAGIVIGALISLFNGIKLKKSGNSPLAVPTIIVSLIGLGLGILTICLAIGGTNLPMIFIGIAMLADGVTLLLAMPKA